MQFPGKLTNQTSENGQKPDFGPNFDPFGSNLGPKKFLSLILPLVARNCSRLSFYAIYKKTNLPNLRKWQKT